MSSDLPESKEPSVDADGFSSDAVLDLEQLETIGNHFLEVLLKMKHNGAIDKTRAGFTALCNRLLCSNDPRYESDFTPFISLKTHQYLIEVHSLYTGKKQKFSYLMLFLSLLF